MATVTFDDATRLYPGGTRPAVDALNLEIADGEFLVLVGPSGCGKSTSLRMLAGLEEVNDGHIFIGEKRRHRHPAEGPRHRDGLPELRAVPAHDRRREHGLRAQDRRRQQGRARPARARGREAARPRAVPRPQAEGPLRWPASARRDGPRDRPSAAGVPHGRAAVEPRRQAPRADPHADRVAAAPPRRHHRLRHARPDRGADHGRPDRGAEGRHPAAGRHPARPVRAARTTCSSPASSAAPP